MGTRLLSPAKAVPSIIIKPSRGWPSLNLAELWQYRELLYFLIWRDVKIRYKQAALGVLWAVIQPFMKVVVFSLIFGRLAKLDSEGFPYPVFLYAGLLPWEFFAESVSRAGQSVVSGANLITKVYFPRLIMPLASVGAALVDFGFSFAILIGLMLFYRVGAHGSIFMVLPLVVATALSALAVGMFVSALDVAYRDFRYILPFLVQVWMYLTPVVYSVTIVPEKLRWLILLNPMAGIVDAYRAAILGKPFEWGNLRISLSVAAILFFFGLAFFRRLERYFADIV